MAEMRSDRRAARREQRAERGKAQSQQPARSPAEEHRTHFLAESWGELKKVEWPTQAHVIQGTVVVLVACLVVGVFLYVNDTVWKHVVQKVLLGQ